MRAWAINSPRHPSDQRRPLFFFWLFFSLCPASLPIFSLPNMTQNTQENTSKPLDSSFFTNNARYCSYIQSSFPWFYALDLGFGAVDVAFLAIIHTRNVLSVCLVCVCVRCICVFFVFKDQRLLHYSWDMNNASRQMNSNPRVNSNFFTIFFYYFQFLVFNKISDIQTHTKSFSSIYIAIFSWIMIGQECIDPLWWINQLISQVN